MSEVIVVTASAHVHVIVCCATFDKPEHMRKYIHVHVFMYNTSQEVSGQGTAEPTAYTDGGTLSLQTSSTVIKTPFLCTIIYVQCVLSSMYLYSYNSILIILCVNRLEEK